MAELVETITERRRKTRNSIYSYLYHADAPKSKQEIATSLSLSLPTVHQNLSELMDAGLLRYAGTQQSTGGRRAMGITIQENARISVGISITERRLRFIAVDLRLQELAYKKTDVLVMHEIEDIGSLIASELEVFLDENQIDRSKLLGVGISVPGVVDMEREAIILAPTLRLKDSSTRKITEKLPYPSYVENDGSSGGFAEWFSRPQRGNMAYLSLENGVGGAVLVHGAPYDGNNRRSGEFGHMCVEPGGLPCNCGKHGCLEAYCSAARISSKLGITLEEFFEGVQAGNTAYQELLEDVLQHMAIGISNIRMTLDCDVVVGGFLSEYLEPYMPRLREYAAVHNPFEPDADYIRLCCHPRRASVLGVALHYIKLFLESI